MNNPYRLRRAQLYVPGDDLHKIEKAAGLGVDSLIMDIEDGVALARKDAARETIARALRTLDFGHTERLVRINPVDSGLEEDDLVAALAMRPDGIVIPKVERPEHILWVSEQIRLTERKRNWPEGSIRILALIETARGIVNLKDIAGSDERLDALIFGQYDLAGSVGATITPEGYESLYARSAIVIHAVAFGLQAIDSVTIDLNDLESVVRDATIALHMGYTGKQAIHPRQIEPIIAVFTPTEEAISAAQRIVDAYEEHQAEGRGAFALDGKMVDMPIVRAAQNVLVRAGLL